MSSLIPSTFPISNSQYFETTANNIKVLNSAIVKDVKVLIILILVINVRLRNNINPVIAIGLNNIEVSIK